MSVALAALSINLSAESVADAAMPTKSGYYLKGDIGHTFGAAAKSMGFDIGAGYNWNEEWRSEVVATFRPSGKYRIDKDIAPVSPRSNFNNSTLMANTFYTLCNYNSFMPYAGVGLGVYHNSSKNVSYTADGANFVGHMSKSGISLSLHLGVVYAIDKDWSVDVNYKAISLGHARLEKYGTGYYFSKRESMVAHEIMLGISYNI